MTNLLKITSLSAALVALLLPSAAQTSGIQTQTGELSAQSIGASTNPSEERQQDGLTPAAAPGTGPLIVGPVRLNCIDKPCSAALITGRARGSGVNGPLTAQTGLTINIDKDNWWTGGKVGEVDGLNVLVRQNGPHSDSSAS